jgi:hypothetical protein
MYYRHFTDEWDIEPGAATASLDLDRGLAGISVCSHKDQFCKRTGRQMADARIPFREGVAGHAWIFVPVLARKNPAYAHYEYALQWLMERMEQRYERITIVRG